MIKFKHKHNLKNDDIITIKNAEDVKKEIEYKEETKFIKKFPSVFNFINKGINDAILNCCHSYHIEYNIFSYEVSKDITTEALLSNRYNIENKVLNIYKKHGYIINIKKSVNSTDEIIIYFS